VTDRWWLGKLAVFSGLFLVVSIGVLQVGVFLGAPVSGRLSIWSVTPLIIGAVVASWVLTTRFERRPLGTLGLRGGPEGLADLGLGTLAGAAIIGGVVLSMATLGWVSWVGISEPGSEIGTALALGGLLMGAAFVEELLFRGYAFQVLFRRFGAAGAIAATSIAFGSLHAWNPNFGALPLLNIGLAGVLLGTAYWRTGSLWFVTGVHLGWNWVMAATDLAVSGLELHMPRFDAVLAGPSLWTGGSFGPEGGLMVTVASLLGTVWMWRLGRRDESLSSVARGTGRDCMSPVSAVPGRGLSDQPTND